MCTHVSKCKNDKIKKRKKEKENIDVMNKKVVSLGNG
jgi:hypothetical protein